MIKNLELAFIIFCSVLFRSGDAFKLGIQHKHTVRRRPALFISSIML